MENFDPLKLENQLCFPLYACAKEVVRKYKPFLDELDLTYTQYITMMVLWDIKAINVKELGAKLYHSLGFTENGEMDGDEIVAVLKL